MKPTAWLLNFARGALIVDDDLIEAVKSKTIAGAVLDVFREEPLPSTHPFWKTEGILVLPHIGGGHPDRPFVLLAQPTLFDPDRAPAGKHVAWAYCHVPNGSAVDMTAAIEGQIERFAPGFRDRILARHRTLPADFERENPNAVGGAITGGVSDLFQFFTRPVARLDPYATPHPRLFICSASTPPGGGVHGMCGYFAARSAWRRLERLPAALPPL